MEAASGVLRQDHSRRRLDYAAGMTDGDLHLPG
jgi:hypothetical protein